jgi:hypothetical protein
VKHSLAQIGTTSQLAASIQQIVCISSRAMRVLRDLFPCACCLLLLSLPARAQEAVQTLSRMPTNSELVITIENASALLEIDHKLITGMAELGWIQQSRPAFDSLAERLGATPLEAFNRLLGRRATLVFRSLNPTPDWAVVVQVDPATATALPGALDAKPLRISSGLHVFALERRNFEIAVTPTDPNTQTAWSVIAPATSAALFDTIVDTLTRQPEPKELLAQGTSTDLFADPLPASIAMYWSPPSAAESPKQAVLAAANREAQSWRIRARATPTKPWFEQGDDAAGLGGVMTALPTVAHPSDDDELVAFWSQHRSGLPMLDAAMKTLLGQVLNEIAAASDGPRGIVIKQSGETKTVLFATLDSSSADMLVKADQLLAQNAGTSEFTGHLPGALRRSNGKASVFLGSTALQELMWWMSSLASGTSHSHNNPGHAAAADHAATLPRQSAWFFLVGTNVRESLSPEQATQWAHAMTLPGPSAHTMLATGRIRPSAFAKGFLPETLQSNLHDLLRKMSIVRWSVYRVNAGVLGADIEIQLVPGAPASNP